MNVDAATARGLPVDLAACTREAWRDDWNPFPPDLQAWSGDPWAYTLLGGVGTGKSHAAAARFFQAVDRAVGTPFPPLLRWVDVPTATDAALTSLHGDGRALQDWQRWGEEAALLVLDDVGAEAGGWCHERVALVLRSRSNGRRATIVTANFGDLDQLRAWDERIGSRLARGVVDILGGPDRREEM